MPAEVYSQGTQFLGVLFFLPVISYVVGEIYLPIFHRLQLESSYTYLEMRFNKWVKVLTGGFFTFALILYISIVVYTPALALEQVTGINVDTSCATICLVCVFYTSVGGIKAVVWTDAFQLFFMFLSAFSVLVVGTLKAGGFTEVFDRNYRDGRIQLFNLDPDVRERHTLWGMTFGGGLMWLSIFGVSQMQIQRYLCLPSIEIAQRAVRLNFILMTLLIMMVGWLGMVLYAVYAECDPITAKQVRTRDQVLPLLVLHVAGDIPGLPGLFMAGVFSGSLSSISSGLNSLAAIALRDFMPARTVAKLSDPTQALLTKIFSFLFGLLAYGLTFLIRYMPGMMEAAIVIGGVVNGPILGVFTIGMLLPWVNSTGVLVGFIGSLVTTIWIATGGTVYKHYNPYVSRTSPPYPTNISGCPAEWLEDLEPAISTPPIPLAGHIPLYDISYIWYTTLGLGLIVVLSLITSLFTSTDLRLLDRQLISPVLPKLWSWMPKSFTFWLDEWWHYIGIDLPKPDLEMKKRPTLENTE